jgi:hypothetical protein
VFHKEAVFPEFWEQVGIGGEELGCRDLRLAPTTHKLNDLGICPVSS